MSIIWVCILLLFTLDYGYTHEHHHESTDTHLLHEGCYLCPKSGSRMCVHYANGPECSYHTSHCEEYHGNRYTIFGHSYLDIYVHGRANTEEIRSSSVVPTITSSTSTTSPPSASTTKPVLHVRLVGGTSPAEGRVEVLYNDVWGTVCDDGWDDDDAKVVCRMLGYDTTFAVHLSKSRFDGGVGPIWLDETHCTGQETNLGQCSYSPIGHNDCDHLEDAGVKCQTMFQVRLVNGPNPAEGRVEVLYNDVWGTVCDDGWDDDDAKVVCRMLGYDPTEATHLSKARYGSGVGKIWLDETQCSGQEGNLGECTFQPIGHGDCDHLEDAGVKCQSAIPSTPSGSWIIIG